MRLIAPAILAAVLFVGHPARANDRQLIAGLADEIAALESETDTRDLLASTLPLLRRPGLTRQRAIRVMTRMLAPLWRQPRRSVAIQVRLDLLARKAPRALRSAAITELRGLIAAADQADTSGEMDALSHRKMYRAELDVFARQIEASRSPAEVSEAIARGVENVGKLERSDTAWNKDTRYMPIRAALYRVQTLDALHPRLAGMRPLVPARRLGHGPSRPARARVRARVAARH